MARNVEWDVTRSGRTVRIDVYAADDLSETDAHAMVAATEELLVDDEVNVVQMNGPVLKGRPPKRVAGVIRAMDDLAHKYGKPLTISPV